MKKKKMKSCAKCLLLFTIAQQTHSWGWEQTPSMFSLFSIIKVYVHNWGLQGN